jgi:hypothetical protein
MAYKIIATNEQNLTLILNNIEVWFKNSQDFKADTVKETRKFFNSDTKEIEERSIKVLEVEEYGTNKQARVRFTPLLNKTEMKVEICGEGEFAIKSRIKNQMKKLGTLKSYNKDTLKATTSQPTQFKLNTP